MGKGVTGVLGRVAPAGAFWLRVFLSLAVESSGEVCGCGGSTPRNSHQLSRLVLSPDWLAPGQVVISCCGWPEAATGSLVRFCAFLGL